MTTDREQSWVDIWSLRSVRATSGTDIADLLVADGYDTPFARVQADAWIDYVTRWAKRLKVRGGTSVYEIGCGAGAFLAPLQKIGAKVGGCDLSRELINLACHALPNADLAVAEGSAVSDQPHYDVVLSNTVFPYFPSLEYARRVIEHMVSKSRVCVAVLDVPDSDLYEEELARRAQLYGGNSAYQGRYDGLQHLVFSRDWFTETFAHLGLHDLWFGHEELGGYANGSTRFSVVATRS